MKRYPEFFVLRDLMLMGGVIRDNSLLLLALFLLLLCYDSDLVIVGFYI